MLLLGVLAAVAVSVSYADEEVPRSARAPLSRVVLGSCEKALGPGECRSSNEDPAPPWTASVEFSGQSVQVRVQTENTTILRSLEFSSSDGEQERHVAAGLLIAAIVAAQPRSLSPDPPPLPAPDTGTPERTSATAALEPVHRTGSFRGELGVTTGATWTPEIWGIGGIVRGCYFPAWQPPVGISFDLRGLHSQNSQFRSAHLEAGLGLTVSLLEPLAPLRLHLVAHPIVNVALVYDVADTLGSRSGVRGGAKIEMVLVPGRNRFSPWFGVYGRWLAPKLSVELDDEPLIVASRWGFGFSVGLAWGPFDKKKPSKSLSPATASAPSPSIP